MICAVVQLCPWSMPHGRQGLRFQRNSCLASQTCYAGAIGGGIADCEVVDGRSVQGHRREDRTQLHIPTSYLGFRVHPSSVPYWPHPASDIFVAASEIVKHYNALMEVTPQLVNAISGLLLSNPAHWNKTYPAWQWRHVYHALQSKLAPEDHVPQPNTPSSRMHGACTL